MKTTRKTRRRLPVPSQPWRVTRGAVSALLQIMDTIIADQSLPIQTPIEINSVLLRIHRQSLAKLHRVERVKRHERRTSLIAP